MKRSFRHNESVGLRCAITSCERGRRLLLAVAAAFTASLAASCAQTTTTVVIPPSPPEPLAISAPAAATASNVANAAEQLPYQIERFSAPGPMAGVIARINLRDPAISTKVVLADDRDPDGDGPCVGQLETPTVAARKHDFVITLNASFFAAPTSKDVMGKKVRYFVGNCTMPVGWHVSLGKIITKPSDHKLRATLLIGDDGNVSIRDYVTEIPPGTRYAVSGNALVLKAGQPTSSDENGTRHPRSVAGVSADGNTLWLVAVDGRQESSRGASMKELGELMRKLGAYDAVNLDGGGSTAMVIKDLRTGTFGVANSTSEMSTEGFPVRMERPVADVIGISLSPTKK
ncbi:MAG: phosphodiester glycosidase family protein [Burkholderiales bacterium]|nr:phosphodiester glycosidase family protein [Betaproteobacteria bacterium]